MDYGQSSADDNSDLPSSPIHAAIEPSKNGPPILCLLRHSVRLDDQCELSAIADVQWPDRMSRPYDTPIFDQEKPIAAARAMQKSGLDFDVVVSSPFRRCLQTASAISKSFGLTSLVVDNRLGEYLPQARRTWAAAGLDPGEYVYVTLDDAAQWAGLPEAGVLWDRSAHPVLIESDDDLAERVATVPQICASALERIQCSSANPHVLLVTHGDVINRLVPSFDWDPSVGRYRAVECGWVAWTGHDRLPAYAGDTVDLLDVARVLACEGIEPL